SVSWPHGLASRVAGESAQAHGDPPPASAPEPREGDALSAPADAGRSQEVLGDEKGDAAAASAEHPGAPAAEPVHRGVSPRQPAPAASTSPQRARASPAASSALPAEPLRGGPRRPAPAQPRALPPDRRHGG